jgi:hypothetical protein
VDATGYTSGQHEMGAHVHGMVLDNLVSFLEHLPCSATHVVLDSIDSGARCLILVVFNKNKRLKRRQSLPMWTFSAGRNCLLNLRSSRTGVFFRTCQYFSYVTFPQDDQIMRTNQSNITASLAFKVLTRNSSAS